MRRTYERGLTRTGRWTLCSVLALAALLACWRMQPLTRSVQADNQVYFFIAERVASGVPPHISIVDHKHQLPALASGLSIAVGRPFGVDDVFAARFLSIAVAVTAVVGLFALTLELTGNVRSALLSAMTFLGFRTVFLEAAVGFRPQLFMMCFTVLAHLVFARGRSFAAGALAACAFLCWQPAALVAASMVVAVLAGRGRSYTAAVRLLAGAAAAIAAYEAYFWWYGALGEQLRQSYLIATSSAGFRPEPILETIDFLTRDIGRGRDLQDYLSAAVLAALIALPVFAVMAPEAAAAAWTRSAAWRAITLCTAGAIAFTFVDHQAYPDRFFYLPYVALVPGVVASLATRFTWGRRGVNLVAAAAALWLAASVVRPQNTELKDTLAGQRRLAAKVADLAHRYDGRIWVLGRLDLLAFNHMDNWSPFGMLLDPRVRAYALARSDGAAFRPLRDGRMPEVILSARCTLGRFARWLPLEYAPLDDAEAWREHHIAASVRLDDSEISRLWVERSCGRRPYTPGAPLLSRPTASDALWVLHGALGESECAACSCDTDGSGRVSAVDALRVLQRSTATRVPLLCPRCPGSTEAEVTSVSRKPRSTSSKRRSTGKPHG